MSVRTCCLSVLLLSIGSGAARAQGWSAEAQFGRIHSSLDPARTTTRSVAAGLRYEGASTQLRILGGIPTQAGEPLWGALMGTQRLMVRTGGFSAGLDLSGNGYLLHDRGERSDPLPSPLPEGGNGGGHALAAQVAPLFGVEHGRFHFQARIGASHYESELGQQRRERFATFGDAQLTVAPVPELALVPAVRRVHVADSNYTFTGVAAMLGARRAVIWAQVGQWLDTGRDGMTWSAGATLRLHDRLMLTGSAREDSFDPLYLTSPQTSWNVGLLVRVGPGVRTRAPVPASYVNGRATILLPRAHAHAQPRIAGDFNGWRPQPMQPTADGWSHSVMLQPGVYYYAFVNDRGEWFVPETHAGRKEDGMGGYVAVLVVQP